jgi:hypothetical protein
MQYHLLQLLAAVNLDTSPLPNSGGSGDVPSTFLGTLLQIVFAVTGSVALLMIVISGFRYIAASGDPTAVAKARSTILYAIIGLAVALTGFSIVTFVVMRVA